MAPRCALLAGATGLVGGHCLDLLLKSDRYTRVVTVGRRPAAREHPKLVQHVVDFDRLADSAALLAADDVFCCLGTTIRQAGSREAFRRVDIEYPASLARLAAEQGARQFLLVSAMGADADSRIFYNRVKGEAEAAVQRSFPHSVTIVRPSLLLGDRDELRPGEAIGKVAMQLAVPLMLGPLRKYRPVEARMVARAMLRLAAAPEPTSRILESDQLGSGIGGQGSGASR